jgi:LasA protease
MPTVPQPGAWTPAPASTALPATPTLSYALPTSRPADVPAAEPTPDSPHFQATLPTGPQTYTVVRGDMLSVIAERYDVSVREIVQANGLVNADNLEVGQNLVIPTPVRQPTGPDTKLIPDSELVYGPNSRLDVAAFVQSKGGYLADLSQDVSGQALSGAQIVQRIGEDYSVNPRLLLAVLEYRTGWVTNPDRGTVDASLPFGYIDSWYVGFYRQMAWAATKLNRGYYDWRYDPPSGWLLADGSVVPVNPVINAGTAGVQNFFATLDDYGAWLLDVSPGGFYDTYYLLFGNPFDYAVEPLVPADLVQPTLQLPFGEGEVWSLTGGPHLDWDFGSPFGALDFAPPGEALGCVPSDVWVTAAAGGLVTRTGDGVVMLDLDRDGLEQTGWVILYMHVESRQRVQPGTVLRAGDRVGHPSCEGGVSSGTHVHIARRFNGEWLPADGPVPFVMSGWMAAGTGEEYVGSLSRNGVVVQSYEGNSSINKIQR